MVDEHIRKKIKSSLMLLSNGDEVEALKCSIDILYKEIFSFFKNEKGRVNINHYEFSKNPINYFNLIIKYFNSKNLTNYDNLFKDIISVIIHFKMTLGDEIEEDYLRYRYRNIVFQIINIILYEEIKRDDYLDIDIFSDTLLNNNRLFDEDEELNIIIDYYYTIYFKIYNKFKINIWRELESINVLLIFNDTEYEKIKEFKCFFETKLFFNQTKDEIDYIYNDIIDILEIEDIINKFMDVLNANKIIEELLEHRNLDITVDKNTYNNDNLKGKREEIFHQNIYPYLCKGMGYTSYLISELSTGNERYDIYYYDKDKEASFIIELKVNDLKLLNKNIEQLKNYLTNVKYKKSVFIEEPKFGVLLIYNNGSKTLINQYDQLRTQYQVKKVEKIKNLLVIKDIEKPIFIFETGKTII